MPSGFGLDNSQAMTLTGQAVAWGGVTAHETKFSNEVAQSADPTNVESAAVVFLTVEGAVQAYDADVAFKEQTTGYTRITAPTYGDASAAFLSSGFENGQPIKIFYVIFYKGNVWGAILIKGAAATTEIEDAASYVQAMLEKIQ